MFHTPGTRSGLRKRPGTPTTNAQIIYNQSGTLAGANLTISAGGALVGNGYGLTLLANNGIVSNTTGVFANISSGLAFVSGATTVLANNGLVSNSTGVFVIANNGLVSNSTGVFVIANNGITTNSTGTFVNADAHFSFTSGALSPNTTSAWTLQDLTLNGNLSVSGTLTTIDTTNLQLKDNFIQLADGLATTTTFLDNVDVGMYLKTGNNQPNNFYSGLARLSGSAGGSTNTNPVFKLFATDTSPGATTLAGAITQGTLEAYLTPYSNNAGGAFVANASVVNITCNSTVGVAITANTLVLTTGLAVSNIAFGTDGQILQSNSTATYWSSIDCGTF